MSDETDLKSDSLQNGHSSMNENKEHPERQIFKILVAEDNPMNRSLNRILIRSMFPNAQIIEATNGLEAVELAAINAPDIVLMDIQMPIMDGYEACSKIREQEVNAKVPIISLTANYLFEDSVNGVNAGFDDFLFKPIVRDSLYTMLIKWLKVN